MVLELKVLHEADLSVLKTISPIFLGYVLSFINVGIFLNHHHHLFQVVEFIDGKVLFAKMHFCLDYLINFFLRAGWQKINFCYGP